MEKEKPQVPIKVLHLGDPRKSMVLWSRMASRYNKPVDFAIAANPGEVKDVIGDYDVVMVCEKSDWNELERIGIDMSKVVFEDHPVPEGKAARRS